MHKGSNSPHLCQNLLFSGGGGFVCACHPDGCELVSHYGFGFHFPNNRNVEHLFLKKRFLFLERREGRERGRETSVCGCFSSVPY